MKVADLQELGFNKNEALVYLSLARFGSADAHQLIKETQCHKNIIYDNLDKLMHKGLVTFIVADGRRVFTLAAADTIVHFFEEQEQALAQKKVKAQQLAKQINAMRHTAPNSAQATIYTGVHGVRTYFSETLHGSDYVVFGGPKESVDIMGVTFWENHNVKRVQHNVKARMIFNPSLKEYGKSLLNKHTQLRYFEGNFEPLTETHVQDDNVAIIVWTTQPLLFLIKDKNVAHAYLQFFENMWTQAKP